jgi:hypothetical protein
MVDEPNKPPPQDKAPPAEGFDAGTLRRRLGRISFGEGELLEIERAFSRWAASRSDQLMAEIEGLCRACERALPDLPTEAVADCRAQLHDISGQAGTLGFPLITTVCRSLGRFLRLDLATPVVGELIAIHLAALRSIAAQRIAGDGGATGRALEAELQQAIEKVRLK